MVYNLWNITVHFDYILLIFFGKEVDFKQQIYYIMKFKIASVNVFGCRIYRSLKARLKISNTPQVSWLERLLIRQ